MKADTARLEIALDTTLWHLPDGAGYMANNGRAHVKASVKHGTAGKPPTLIIESGCDSLRRLYIKYMVENRYLTAENKHLQESKQTAVESCKKRMNVWVWLGMAAGLSLGAVITILIKKVYGSIRRN